MLLRNRLYAGVVDVPEYGVRDKRGHVERLILEDLFYCAGEALVLEGTGFSVHCESDSAAANITCRAYSLVLRPLSAR